MLAGQNTGTKLRSPIEDMHLTLRLSAVWRERYLKDFVAGDKSKSAQRLATPGTQMNWKDAYMMAVQQNPLLQVSYLHPHTRANDTALT